MADHIGGSGLPDENRGPVILAATSIVTISALLTVLARMYVRVFMIRNVGADDYTMALTMVLSLTGWAIIIPEVVYGAGRHTAYVMDTAVKANQLNFATQGIYMWAIGFVKVSIGLFLLRFAPRRGYRVFIWAIIGLSVIAGLKCAADCCSVHVVIYDDLLLPLNILTDLIFAILPAFMLRHLQVNRRVKASLVCILGLGIFACAAAFVKLSILPNYGRTGDFLWDYTDLTIWVVVECNTGIIAGSLPTLKPLFKQVLGSYGSQGSHSHYHSHSRSRTRNYSRGTRHKLRSLSRQHKSKAQTLGSGNSDVEAKTQRTGELTYQSGYETTMTATYPGGEGRNSSDERILPSGGEGIVCVTDRAGVVVNEGPDFQVKVEMVPVPEPGPDDILIRLNVTGLCSSDIHMMKNDLGTPPMSFFGVRSPGHEGAGIVVKTGANVRNFKVGDRAGIKPLTDTCGSCELCWGDKETYCRTAVHTGLMTAGTYQQYLVSPARYASPIPDGVPDEIAAPIMCSASTIYRSLVESGLRPGDWAVFPGGGGGVGIQGVQLARAMGMRPIVVDTGPAKRALAMEMGAEAFVDFAETQDTTAAVVAAADGIGAHGVFVTAPAAYRTALSFVGDRIGAVVMCIGLAPAKTMVVGDDPNRFIFKNLTIKGTLVGSRRDTAAALDFARRGMLKQICEVYPIDRLPEAVEKLRRGEVAGRIVVKFDQ
ncbi:hypothetical protein CNMCM8694_004036 [Aspergillus lentulus]|nr:hypothetical protein CNMCM8060_002861 [Aspergillus lentulus]KAF4197016.1 hypothetical protein CNMCM8694_004036 [Aspergillus lentulus]